MRQDYARMLQVLAEVDSRGVAARLGYSNTPALLVHVLRVSRADARHRLAQAEDLLDTTTLTGSVVAASMPLTAAALERGEVGSGHVDVIRRTLRSMAHLDAERRGWAEELLVIQAGEDDPAALLRHAGRIRDIVDPDGTPPVDDGLVLPERLLRRHVRRDGRMEFKGWLDPENAALFDTLLKPFEKSDPEVPDTRGQAERAGDAFADVLKMAANCPDLPTKNGVRTEVAFTIPLDALIAAADDTILPGQSHYLTAREARRIACDSHVLPAVMGGESQPLDIAVPAYVVPSHIRRGLVLRDRGCTFPSCDRPASVCDAHHVLSWHRGGATQIDNLILLCGQHHRLIHRSQWAVRLDNGHAVFTPPAFVDPRQRPRVNRLRQ
ncbi:HNH endonuclease [Actinocrispum wychmicini]|uniref:HNH endonuclease n=2 Tax=Actinocrispum wychmicini TaxID=1213861 RepID=A0A4R2K0U3_9PSEU|nr:HNH endonuclease signature motif containing protein [Actinocrispum wychmicini]TCO59925.1 HNH endonuclease [Actinocrispum wychmicini]